jgi:hypothetical protein
VWVLVAAVLFVVAVVAYFYLCGLALVYVVAPLTPWALLGGAGAGLVIVLVTVFGVLAGFDFGVRLRTPRDVVEEPLPEARRDRYLRRDLAWPVYFMSQLRLDAAAAGRTVADALVAVWRAPFGWASQVDGRFLLAVWPLLIPVVALPIGISVGVMAGLLAVWVLVGVVAVLIWLCGLAVVAALRTADRAWQVSFRAGASCPVCYEVSQVPAYRCPGPHPPADAAAGLDLHRDVRPGRLGVLWRRCGCGRLLPTTVLRAARVMDVCCPRCTTPLPAGAAVHTDVRIPVFGAVSAGKTHLIMAGLVALTRAGDADPEVKVVPADEHSTRMLAVYRRLVDSGGAAPKTNAAAPPVAVTMRLARGRRRAMLHLFDAAGETLADFDQNSELAYLDRARALVFVLDPFSIADVRDRYAARDPDLVQRANPALGDPEASYNATVGRLRAHGVDTGTQRLAFVVSKRDLIAEVSGIDDEAGIRAWLVEQRLDNLVIAAERDFGEVRYFLVSATQDAVRGGADQPFRWLLAVDRVPLPAMPRPDVVPPAPRGPQRMAEGDRV